MKLEKQVCSLELAKKLKELGVKQESLFSWCNFGKDDWRGPYANIDGNTFCCHDTVGCYTFSESECMDVYSAFTVAELGEMLPKGYNSWFGCYESEDWGCSSGEDFCDFIQEAKTEADARAKMLIYLIENNHLNKYEEI